MNHLLSLEEAGQEFAARVLDRAMRLKTGEAPPSLAGTCAALVFLNPSLRTRTAFEVAMAKMQSHAVVLTPGADAWKLEAEEGVEMLGAAAEHVKEAAGVLSSMCGLIGVRSFPEMKSWSEDAKETTLRAFARHSTVPVVNMESSLSHPLQALADLMTLRSVLGRMRRRKLLVTWAYHPKPLPIAVPRSAILAALSVGMEVRVARPDGFALPAEIEADCEVVTDPDEGYDDVDAVYAKSWASPAFYGRLENEKSLRETARDWRVTTARMNRATSAAPFLHCLPVRRNVVVDDEVLDGPRSVVIKQAENRLWTTMAAVLELLGK